MKLLLIVPLLLNFVMFAQRDPRNKGEANVFWNGTYPLYSLTSDQEIKPNSSGKYNFWGTTNENPVPKEYSLIKGSKLYVYKFINYDECVKLCNEIRQRNGMQLLNSKDIVQSNEILELNSKDDYATKFKSILPATFSSTKDGVSYLIDFDKNGTGMMMMGSYGPDNILWSVKNGNELSIYNTAFKSYSPGFKLVYSSGNSDIPVIEEHTKGTVKYWYKRN